MSTRVAAKPVFEVPASFSDAETAYHRVDGLVASPSLPRIAQTLRLEGLLARVVAALGDIPNAVFKGPALAHAVWPEPHRRFYSDIDLLVHPRDLPAVDAHLTALGLFTFERTWQEALADVYGELPYSDHQGSALDVHWHVIREARQREVFDLDTLGLLDRAVPLQTPNVTFRALSLEDLLITTAVHACFDGAYRLGWLIDLRLLETHPSIRPEVLVETCRSTGTAAPVQAMLERSRRVLGYTAVLPRLTSGSWLSALDALTVVRPPGKAYARLARGGLFFRATRSTTRRSILMTGTLIRDEFIAPVLQDPDHRWRRRLHDREA
jgi:hypothetical protein